jgi:hypothetical protein
MLLQIPFARVDADKLKDKLTDYDISSLPTLIFFNQKKSVNYVGYHALEPVLGFIDKQLGKPVIELKTVEEVEAFIQLRNERKYSVSTVHVVSVINEIISRNYIVS